MQETYRGEPTARIRLYALFEQGDERSNEELAKEIGCSWHTVRTYRQDWNREHGESTKPTSNLLDVPLDDLPLLTLHGWMWCEPISMRLNCEITMLMLGKEFANEVEKMLEADFAKSKLATSAEYTDRSLLYGFIVRASRLTAPVQ